MRELAYRLIVGIRKSGNSGTVADVDVREVAGGRLVAGGSDAVFAPLLLRSAGPPVAQEAWELESRAGLSNLADVAHTLAAGEQVSDVAHRILAEVMQGVLFPAAPHAGMVSPRALFSEAFNRLGRADALRIYLEFSSSEGVDLGCYPWEMAWKPTGESALWTRRSEEPAISLVRAGIRSQEIPDSRPIATNLRVVIANTAPAGEFASLEMAAEGFADEVASLRDAECKCEPAGASQTWLRDECEDADVLVLMGHGWHDPESGPSFQFGAGIDRRDLGFDELLGITGTPAVVVLACCFGATEFDASDSLAHKFSRAGVGTVIATSGWNYPDRAAKLLRMMVQEGVHLPEDAVHRTRQALADEGTAAAMIAAGNLRVYSDPSVVLPRTVRSFNPLTFDGCGGPEVLARVTSGGLFALYPRAVVEEQVHDWWSGSGKPPVLILAGEAGQGKSSVLARIIERTAARAEGWSLQPSATAAYFFQASGATGRDFDALLDNIVEQLARQSPQFPPPDQLRSELNERPIDAMRRRVVVPALLAFMSTLICIDALDEANSNAARQLRDALRDIGAGCGHDGSSVRFLLTSRNDHALINFPDAARTVAIAGGQSDDAMAWVRETLVPSREVPEGVWRARLQELDSLGGFNNSFLVARSVLGEILREPEQPVTAIPSSVRAAFRLDLERIKSLAGEHGEQISAHDVLSIVAIGRNGLTQELLVDLFGSSGSRPMSQVESQVDAVTSGLRHWLMPVRAEHGQTAWQPFHVEFQRFIADVYIGVEPGIDHPKSVWRGPNAHERIARLVDEVDWGVDGDQKWNVVTATHPYLRRESVFHGSRSVLDSDLPTMNRKLVERVGRLGDLVSDIEWMCHRIAWDSASDFVADLEMAKSAGVVELSLRG